MAIQPVTSANFTNNKYNNISFGNKSKDVKRHNSLRSAAMAVPLATLIAMSPMNTYSKTNSNMDIFPVNTELYQDDSQKTLIKRVQITNVKGLPGKNYINFYDTDGIPNTTEKLTLETIVNPTTSFVQDIDLLQISKEKDDDGSTKLTYSVIGDRFMQKKDAKGNVRKTKVASQREVTKPVFDFIENAVGNNVLIKDIDNTKQSAKVKTNKSSGVTIEKKNFKSKTLGNVTISLKSTDGNNKDFEAVEISHDASVNMGGRTLKSTITDNVKGLYTYKYNVISDDGVNGSKFSIKAVWGDNDITATTDKVILNYFESLSKDPRNNDAFETKTITRNLRPSADGCYQNVPNGDILKGANPETDCGKLVAEQDINDNRMGKFRLRLYSTDDNDNNAERITFQKEGYPEVEIVSAYTPLHTFAGETENPYVFRSGVVVLRDYDSKLFYIESNSLVKFLYDIGYENIYNKEINYLFADSGIAAPVVEKE